MGGFRPDQLQADRTAPADAAKRILVIESNAVFSRCLVRERPSDLSLDLARSYSEAELSIWRDPPLPAATIVALDLADGRGRYLVEKLARLSPIVAVDDDDRRERLRDALLLGAVDLIARWRGARALFAAVQLAELPAMARQSLPMPQRTLAFAEEECIREALIASHGNVTKAARLLGVHRYTLQRKMARLPTRSVDEGEASAMRPRSGAG